MFYNKVYESADPPHSWIFQAINKYANDLGSGNEKEYNLKGSTRVSRVDRANEAEEEDARAVDRVHHLSDTVQELHTLCEIIN